MLRQLQKLLLHQLHQRGALAAHMKALEEMGREEQEARKEEDRYRARLKALKKRPSTSAPSHTTQQYWTSMLILLTLLLTLWQILTSLSVLQDLHVKSLYPFEGDGLDDLSENFIFLCSPGNI